MMENSPNIIIVSSNDYLDILPLCINNLVKTVKDEVNIHLVTQDVKFHHAGIIVHNNHFNDSWSKRLLKSLVRIKSDSVLLLFDDYVLSYFDWTNICELELQMNKQNLDVIKLRNKFYPEQKNSFSFQLSLWRRSSLIAVLREHENPWQSEVWGRLRTICSEWKSVISDKDLVAYHPAGVIKKGAWNLQALELLSETEIGMIDIEKRVLFSANDEKSRLYRILLFLFSDWKSTVKSFKSIYK